MKEIYVVTRTNLVNGLTIIYGCYSSFKLAKVSIFEFCSRNHIQWGLVDNSFICCGIYNFTIDRCDIKGA